MTATQRHDELDDRVSAVTSALARTLDSIRSAASRIVPSPSERG